MKGKYHIERKKSLIFFPARDFKKKTFFLVLHCFLREVQVIYMGKALQPQEQHYPSISACVVFLCVQTVVWLPVLGTFNMHTNIDACDTDTVGLH